MKISRGDLLGGRYEIIQVAGRGGIGEVWEAIDRANARTVAVKVLSATFLGDHHARKRFEREGELLARVTSPFVCRFYEACVDETSKTPFLVVERLVGTTLHERLRERGALTLHEAAGIIEDVLRGVVAIHEAGIVHRDLKPANVFLEQRQDRTHALLIDFGIAKLMGELESALTSRGAVMGTPTYMAPELLASARQAEPRSDVYSAVTIAFRALAGTLPFDAEPIMSHVALKRSFSAPSLSERTGRSWPEPLERFVATGLAREIDRRPPSAAAALEAWLDVCSGVDRRQ